MVPRTSSSEKPKRRKKRKSRTEVSSDSDTEKESQDVNEKEGTGSNASPKTIEVDQKENTKPSVSKELSDAEVSAAFTKFYMQRVASEFSDDLDRLRNADDFKDDAVPILIHALQQGTSLFSVEEQRIIVTAEMAREKRQGTKMEADVEMEREA